MIVSLTALLAVTAITPEADAGGAPLDDLAVIEALADDAALDDEDASWLDLHGYTDAEVAAHRHRDDHRRWRRHRVGGRYGAQRADVLSTRKDLARRRDARFGLPGGAQVGLPGPGGTGGRIVTDALTAEAETLVSFGGDDSTVPTVTRGRTTEDDAAAPDLDANGTARPDGAAPQREAALHLNPAMTLSFDKAAAAQSDAVATPLPPSLLLFASGMGLFGLSRRKGG